MIWSVEVLKNYHNLVLHNNAFNIAKNPNCHGYQRGFASMVYKFKKDCTNCTNQLLESLKKEKYILLFKTILEAMNLQICN